MILQRMSEVIVRPHVQRNSLNLVALWSPYVLPVPHGSGMTNDEGDIHHGVFDTDAPVGTTSEDKVISRVRLSGTVRIQPTGGVKLLGIAVDLGILKRVVKRGNDHAVGGNGVVIRDREGTGSLVGDL